MCDVSMIPELTKGYWKLWELGFGAAPVNKSVDVKVSFKLPGFLPGTHNLLFWTLWVRTARLLHHVVPDSG